MEPLSATLHYLNAEGNNVLLLVVSGGARKCAAPVGVYFPTRNVQLNVLLRKPGKLILLLAISN
jgi:hypothetical protein